MFGLATGGPNGVYTLMLFGILALALAVAEAEEATDSITGFAPFQVIVYAGHPVVLNCTIDGNVSPRQIWWKHNDRIFLSAARNDITCRYKLQWLSDGKTVQLTIPVATPENSGPYECVALGRNSAKKHRDWHALGNRVVVHVIGEQLELTDTDCNAVGEKTVNVLWKPATVFESPTQYSVYFCKDPHTRLSTSATPEKDYKFGCSEIAHQGESSKFKSQYRQCNLGEPLDLDFPSESFSYYIKANNSNKIYWSKKKDCKLAMKFRCTKPQNLMVESAGSRTLTLQWSYPPFMGESTDILCYRIVYTAEGDLANMTQITLCPVGVRSTSFRYLKPYTRYKFYVQCSIESNNPKAWGDLAGPAENITWEEAPSEAPEFIVSDPIERKYGQLRNVTVAWKNPSKNTWNGVLSHFIINFWKVKSSNKTKSASQRVIILDGRATRGVICGLERFSDYRCTVKMCTKAGCGPSSEIQRIFPEIADRRSQPDAPTKSSSPSLQLWHIILIAAIVTAVIFLIIAAGIACRRTRRNLEPLNDIMTVSALSTNSLARENQENAKANDDYAQISELTAESTEPGQQPLGDEQIRFAPEKDMPNR